MQAVDADTSVWYRTRQGVLPSSPSEEKAVGLSLHDTSVCRYALRLRASHAPSFSAPERAVRGDEDVGGDEGVQGAEDVGTQQQPGLGERLHDLMQDMNVVLGGGKGKGQAAVSRCAQINGGGAHGWLAAGWLRVVL